MNLFRYWTERGFVFADFPDGKTGRGKSKSKLNIHCRINFYFCKRVNVG